MTTLPLLEFKETRLPNGLRVLAEINPEARSVAVGYGVMTGGRDESPQESGISHFLEHMVFKGTSRRSALEVNLAFDRMGARYNAFTSEETTFFYGSVLPEFGLSLLELLSDLMRPALRPEDFETEKQVILEEIALYADRPQFMLFDWARAHFFGSHPLGQSVLGTAESIRAMTPELMAAYHQRRYVPSNMVLAFSGKLDWEVMLEAAERWTSSWPTGQAGRDHPKLEPTTGRVRRPYEKARQVYLAALAPGYAAQDPRRHPAAILAEILGDAHNSRLYWALEDRGLVESVDAGHEEADQAGLFYVVAQMAPEREEEVREILESELERLVKDGVRPEEVEQAKTRYATSLVFAGETPMQRLFKLAFSYLYTGRYESLAETAAAIQQITPKEIHELLEDGFFQKRLIYSLVPAEAS